jgi:SAM-dependent methyltransferase
MDGPMGRLTELFHCQVDIDHGLAAETLGPEALDAFEASGLIARDGTRVRPTVRIASVGGLHFASDLSRMHRSRARDFVLGAGGVTRRLADLTVRDPVASVLDLGAGAGVLAGLAAAHAVRVVATDINARAVSFSRFNAELNGLTHMECREGSLFDPVRGERFDLIVCNPPYVISPASTFVYRDGGTDLCRTIVREAAGHLEPTGLLQMLVEWPEREGADWREEVTSWLDGAGCDAWLLRFYSEGAEAYATNWLTQEYDGGDVPAEAHAAWVAHLRGLGIASVGGGILMLRPARGPSPRAVLRVGPRTVGAAGPSLRRWLACQDLLVRVEDARALLDTVLVPAPDLERTDRSTPDGTGWAAHPTELRLRSGFTFGARVDPVAVAVIGLLDGKRTPREALERFTRTHGVSPNAFLGGLPGALERLVGLGLLVPADFGGGHLGP